MESPLNMGFGERVVIHTAELDWPASPSAAVSRKPLERPQPESGHVM